MDEADRGPLGNGSATYASYRKVLSELSISIGVHGFDHTSLVEDSTHAAEENVQLSLTQRRLHHIDDGANAPWKSRGRFLQELRRRSA